MKEIIIREVWAHNLKSEFHVIKILLPSFKFISLDTEFPGTIYSPKYHHRYSQPAEAYRYLKANVDNTNIIQLGLTLSNAQSCIVWEFNFKDFNLARGDLHNPDSIQLLKRQGIDFERNTRDGIDSKVFAELFKDSGLVCNYSNNVNWIGFQTGCDFAYLIKILTKGKELPDELSGFMGLVWFCFGTRVYDMKHMMKYCNGLYGGLDRVAKALEVDRTAGNCHQAGSDSLLTMMTFLKMMQLFFVYMDGEQFDQVCRGVLFGLELDHDPGVAIPVPSSFCK